MSDSVEGQVINVTDINNKNLEIKGVQELQTDDTLEAKVLSSPEFKQLTKKWYILQGVTVILFLISIAFFIAAAKSSKWFFIPAIALIAVILMTYIIGGAVLNEQRYNLIARFK